MLPSSSLAFTKSLPDPISAGGPEDVGCSWPEQLGEQDSDRRQSLGDGRAKIPEREVSWVVCFMRKFSVFLLWASVLMAARAIVPNGSCSAVANRA